MRTLIASVVGCLAPWAAGQLGQPRVLVVDPAGGGDFLQIREAVLAAADGDAVLVKSGTYEPFVAQGLSLVVTADAGAAVSVAGRVRIEDLAAEQTLALLGVDAHQSGPQAALSAGSCAGPVWVQGGSFTKLSPGGTNAGLTASVTGCDAVVLRGCTFQGADGPDSIHTAGTGLAVAGSTAVLDDVLVTGGTGFVFPFAALPSTPGGTGLSCTSSTVRALGCELRGGAGGAAGPPPVSYTHLTLPTIYSV